MQGMLVGNKDFIPLFMALNLLLSLHFFFQICENSLIILMRVLKSRKYQRVFDKVTPETASSDSRFYYLSVYLLCFIQKLYIFP